APQSNARATVNEQNMLHPVEAASRQACEMSLRGMMDASYTSRRRWQSNLATSNPSNLAHHGSQACGRECMTEFLDRVPGLQIFPLGFGNLRYPIQTGAARLPRL